MAGVRDGKRPFVVLDVLHREMLEDVLTDRGIDPAEVDPATLEDWSHA